MHRPMLMLTLPLIAGCVAAPDLSFTNPCDPEVPFWSARCTEGGLGAPCESNETCVSGVCAVPSIGEVGACSRRCDPIDDPCPAGYACVQGSPSLCVADAGGEGEDELTSPDCDDRETCEAACEWLVACVVSGGFCPGYTEDQSHVVNNRCVGVCRDNASVGSTTCGHTTCQQTITYFSQTFIDFTDDCLGLD